MLEVRHEAAPAPSQERTKPEFRSLLIAPIYAASLLTGGGQRTFHVHRGLARLGSTDVLLISEEAFAPLEASLEELRTQFRSAGSVAIQRSTPQFLSAPRRDAGVVARGMYLARRIRMMLRDRARFYRPNAEASNALNQSIATGRYDVLVGRYLQCAALAGAFEQRDVPVVVDLDDLDERVLASREAAPNTGWLRKRLLRWHALQVSRIVKRLRARAQHVFTASEADGRFVGHRSSSILPNIPYLPDGRAWPAFQPSSAASQVILFVGSFGHRLNRDGLLHFIARCWPLIVARVPAAELRVVGSGGWESLRETMEATRNVKVVGAVDDLASEYMRAAFCVVPIFEGSGTKIKVLEALMYGRAVVATEHSAYGYEKLLDHGLWRARSVAELVDACVGLLDSPTRRNACGALGYEIVKSDFSFEAVFETVRAALVGVVPLEPAGS